MPPRFGRRLFVSKVPDERLLTELLDICKANVLSLEPEECLVFIVRPRLDLQRHSSSGHLLGSRTEQYAVASFESVQSSIRHCVISCIL